jgi:hypothetical protein
MWQKKDTSMGQPEDYEVNGAEIFTESERVPKELLTIPQESSL